MFRYDDLFFNLCSRDFGNYLDFSFFGDCVLLNLCRSCWFFSDSDRFRLNDDLRRFRNWFDVNRNFRFRNCLHFRSIFGLGDDLDDGLLRDWFWLRLRFRLNNDFSFSLVSNWL